MPKNKYENLSIKELNKKKKQGKWVLIILIGSALLVLISNSVIYFKDPPSFTWTNVGIIFAIVPIFIGLYSGIKKIDEELKRRDES